MNQTEIIQMARMAGGEDWGIFRDFMPEIERFAKLVAEKEREEIAEFIESTNLGSLPEQTALHYAKLLRSYSTAIRARGQQ